jgi:hypothetical protein
MHLALGLLFGVYPLVTERGMYCNTCRNFLGPNS